MQDHIRQPRLTMQLRSDTIVALSTAPGRSAIAIVRLSGPAAHVLAQRVCDRWPSRARECTRSLLHDPATGAEIDEALITRFDPPHSYTSEAVVEFACHGGLAVYQDLIGILVAMGARLAEPGEFTQRAVLNGKLDLLQAEAVGDLVDAGTAAHRTVALAQLHGSLSQLIRELRESVVHIEALLAYDVDFPEEDDGPVPRDRILHAAATVVGRLDALIATAPLGEVARDGALVVIAGPPNAGKSSLFNALLGEERAIVTEIPGTTRDAIEVRVPRQPWPIRLVDTAGLRPTDDLVERMGIEVSERHIAAAHLVLVCGETRSDVLRTEAAVRSRCSAPVIRVLTKADQRTEDGDQHMIAVSAHTRMGLARLLEGLDEILSSRLGQMPTDGSVLLRVRHRVALETARRELTEFLAVWEAATLPATLAAIHVRSATNALDDMIGVVDVEQVLDRVFRTFCVGK